MGRCPSLLQSTKKGERVTMAWQFGETALENAWKKVKKTIQAPHIYTSIKKSTVRHADAWASAKWGCAFDYQLILRYLGVNIIED